MQNLIVEKSEYVTIGTAFHLAQQAGLLDTARSAQAIARKIYPQQCKDADEFAIFDGAYETWQSIKIDTGATEDDLHKRIEVAAQIVFDHTKKVINRYLVTSEYDGRSVVFAFIADMGVDEMIALRWAIDDALCDQFNEPLDARIIVTVEGWDG